MRSGVPPTPQTAILTHAPLLPVPLEEDTHAGERVVPRARLTSRNRLPQPGG